MDISRDWTELYKIWITGGAMVLALVWAFLPRRVSRGALVALLLVAMGNYARFGPLVPTMRVDVYDNIHYYLNAKYFDELGYYDLYPAILLVATENGGPIRETGPQYMAQDANGHQFRPISHGVGRGRQVRKEKFSDERWEAFTHDALHLLRTRGCMSKHKDGSCRAELSAGMWREMIQDHGFNGTTAWTLVAEPITQVVPVEAIKLLGYLDIVLLGAAIGAVWWAYGSTAAGFTTLFLFTTYSTRWPTLSWVFLRYDWVAALLFATALLRKGKPLAAGMFAGWAATLRFFPAMWMWGPLGKGVMGLFRKHVHKQLLVFAGGFLLCVGLLQGAVQVRYGSEPVTVHLENMLDHNDPMQLSSRRIGLAQALSHMEGGKLHKYITTRQKKRIEEQKPLRYGLALLVMMGIFTGVRRARDDEAYALGFLPFYLLTTASYYYYVARIPLVVVHAGELHRLRNRVGLAFLFGLETLSHLAQVYEPDFRMVLIGYLAIGLAVYSVGAVVWLHVEAWRGEDAPEAPAPDEVAPMTPPRWAIVGLLGAVGYVLLAVGMMNHRRLPGLLEVFAGTGHTIWYVVGTLLLTGAVAALWTPKAEAAAQ